MNISRSTWFKISALLCTLGLVLAGLWYWSHREGPIYDFDYKRDAQEILKIFERDRYWLLMSEDFSPEFMLKYRAPNPYEIQYLGRLHIKVLREKDQFAGFAAYYMKEAGLGWLLFLDVNPDFRGKNKRCAEKLLKYALEDMKKMGAASVKLFTRTDNLRAQGLYRRVGFHEISRDNAGGMYFQYDF
jgi:ribosomal protein S18 acetylase RimI-like enzyme